MSTPLAFADLQPGDPAPWFTQRSPVNPRFHFDTLGGRYIVLGFFVSAGDAQARRGLDALQMRPDLLDGERIAFFGVSCDPRDESEARIADIPPGFRFFWDFDGTVSRLYGCLPREAAPQAGGTPARRFWAVLSPTLRVIDVIAFEPDGSDVARLIARLEALPPPETYGGVVMQAPVLLLPDVFSRDLCGRLIDAYRRAGGEESGFMRQIDGKTVYMHDARHKKRSDHTLADPALTDETRRRVVRAVAPEITKAYQFVVTRMERYLVCRYGAEDGGHFAAHRDNTTSGTAHRRFAVSINLNDAFEGGEVGFPEYGPRRFKAPPGGAVIFSCSLLHSVSTVTAGERFAFLPFLYDEEAAKIRARNADTLVDGTTAAAS